jgi:hypothetical protein
MITGFIDDVDKSRGIAEELSRPVVGLECL